MTLAEARKTAGIKKRYFDTFVLFMSLYECEYRKDQWGLLTEMANSKGLHRSRIYRHLEKLANDGLVNRTGHGAYAPTNLGKKTYRLLRN